MCQWGKCQALQSVRRCRFCGTKFCIECGRGEFPNKMETFDRCILCRMPDFQELCPEPKKRLEKKQEIVKVKNKKNKKKNN